MRYAVIMAGGSGTRLWPLSRQGTPKQLLQLFDGKSLLQLAYDRLAGLLPPERILVCTGASYAAAVAQQLPELLPENLLGEPVGRDSLGAVAWSAAVLAERDPAAVVAMLAADHIMEPKAKFQAALRLAFEVAEQSDDALVTMGVVPSYAHTGYGYLERGEELADFPGVHQVRRFKEKPAAEVAQQYLASGNYWWNSGMFCWQARTLLAQLAALLPDEAAKVSRMAADPACVPAVFATLEPNSVDFAIMEPVSAGATPAQVVAVPLDLDWRDVGGYVSLAEQFSVDADGNRILGCSVSLAASGCIIINTQPDHVVAGLAVADTLIVHTDQATLVADITDAQRVKQLVDLVRDRVGQDFC